MIGANDINELLICSRITPEDKERVKELKRINAVIFPQAYNDVFYKKLLSVAQFFLVYDASTQQLIGALSFLFLTNETSLDAHLKGLLKEQTGNFCYIMNLGVLSVYRRNGYGTCMWNFVKARAEEYFGNQQFEYSLHVQENNRSAIAFYDNLGFSKLTLIKDYYRNLDNADALVMARKR